MLKAKKNVAKKAIRVIFKHYFCFQDLPAHNFVSADQR